MKSNDDTLRGDVLRGAAEIAKFIGEPVRRTFYLIENKQIPAGKRGAVWLGSKSALREHHRRLTCADAAT